MAQLLSTSSPARTAASLWAVDKVILAYLAATSILIVYAWRNLPQAPWLLPLHLIAGMAIVLLSRSDPDRAWVLRNWYALPLVASCYREMAELVPAVRGTATADRFLADLDYSIWHANPTVWLERLQTPWMTDFFQLAYALFVPAVLLVPFLLWKERRFGDFRYSAFLIAGGFLASYVGYLIVPARGPRFLFDHLQAPLEGGVLVHVLRAGLDWLESAHYDCFPSGHTELTMIAWWSSRQISNGLFAVYSAYTLCIIFATVYLRYHYSVDVVAGALVAAALIALGPAMYRILSGAAQGQSGPPATTGLCGDPAASGSSAPRKS